ncbi:hypothetical protein L1987_51656 [Smallanthus sonchifolius]|uniref:Uncharacterized protein n=1 Tax=Smallanthus sonchifolius TaxID=185202 RepID=A0ACB9EQC8_9ASTR|nr:hypothetical protein L1987_51656 [Smallanthus sonchifolius]
MPPQLQRLLRPLRGVRRGVELRSSTNGPFKRGCSSGSLMPDGTVTQTGGTADGELVVRTYSSCDTCDWEEIPTGLVQGRCCQDFSDHPRREPRNYPSTGSGVLLSIRIVNGTVGAIEFLVCGGAPRSAFPNAFKEVFDGALDSCGRIVISDPDPQWVMESMPLARVMGDMLLLPNGDVLIINGASAGVAGWEFGRDPVLSPVVYRPGNPIGSRFELSLEEFSPAYLDSNVSGLRPVIISPMTSSNIGYGNEMVINFAVSNNLDPVSVMVTLGAPSFNTHSFSMNQRLLVLDSGIVTTDLDSSNYLVSVAMPPSANIAPTGLYLLFVVHKDIPSEGIWIHIQ